MTLQDFGSAFASIARSGKPGKGVARGRTRSGRVKIGKFGLGTLAVVAICDRLAIRSTKDGSTQGFVARLDIQSLRRHFDRGENLSEWWKFTVETWTEQRSNHFTELRLEGLDPQIRHFLEVPGELKLNEEFERVQQLKGLDQLAWRLGLICPLPYEAAYPIREGDLNPATDSILIARSRRLLRDRFALYFNGEPIRRRILLPRYKSKSRDDADYSRLMKRGLGYEVSSFKSPAHGPVKYEGYVIVQAQALYPLDLRGLLVRLRGVGIGNHATLKLARAPISTMLAAMSGEIWVESGLDDALQFDRESFREDHPNFVWFREQIETEVEKQEPGFRQRSARRTRIAKGTREKGRKGDGAAAKSSRQAQQPSRVPTSITDSFIDSEIFRGCPQFIGYLLPQINGCWQHSWYEACAVITRRLLETLIIHLYSQRGWDDEIKAPEGGYVRLQKLVDKACGDQRLGLNRREQEGLRHLKTIGDLAAHDYKIRITRNDLEQRRTELRFACQRLLFTAQS